MKAYRINRDLTVDEIDAPIESWKTPDIVWAMLGFDTVNDIWYDDEALFDPGAITASIGRHPRVPLPAYIVGSDGEDFAPPTIPIDLVRLSLD
ncbi:hypothetical protein [Sphingomonas sp. 3-13AW]|uniref:hypothetical protein n=1 Tax=Sphingomonas sp. 3-13AW TaxID=3050450 RepID=UPI003BB6072D